MEPNIYDKIIYGLGVHPNHPLRTPHIVLNIVAFLWSGVLSTYNLYLTADLRVLKSPFIFISCLTKYVTLILQRDVIINIMEMSKHFMNTDMVRDNHITFLKQYLVIANKYFVRFLVFAILSFAAEPLILKDTFSMYRAYYPPQIPFPLFYVMEFYVCVISATTYIAFNLLMCRLIILVVQQFRLLNLKIKNSDFPGAIENDHNIDLYKNCMKENIKYHQYLIRLTEELNKILSTPVALLMIASVTLLCSDIYILSLIGGSQLDKVQAIVSSSAIITEYFLIYGLPAQLLMNEAEDSANMIYYECDWYLPNLVPLRRDLLIMMVRSQTSVSIRAGNYYLINNQTVVMASRHMKNKLKDFYEDNGVMNEVRAHTPWSSCFRHLVQINSVVYNLN